MNKNKTISSGEALKKLIQLEAPFTRVVANTQSTAETTAAAQNNEETQSSPSSPAQAALDALEKNEKGNRRERISSTINALEADYSAPTNGEHEVNTGYIDKLFEKDSYQETMFNDLFEHIKEVVGTEGFSENQLKTLLENAWRQSIDNSNKKEDISEFLNKVYTKFKDLLKTLQDKPEYTDILTDKGVTELSNGSLKVVGKDDEKTQDLKISESGINRYDEGSVHISDNNSDLYYKEV